MARRIGGGAMVSVGPGALSVTVSTGQWRGGVRQNVGTTAVQLSSESIPCSLVWICPELDANGEPANTAVVLVGDSETQNMPLMPTDPAGIWLPVEDVNLVYVKAVSGTQKVNWRVV